MSVAFDSLNWKTLDLEPTSRPGASSKQQPIMAAQLDATTQVEVWGARTGTLSMILNRQGQMPIMVTDTGYSPTHQEIAAVIDMRTWPAEFSGQQVIPRDEPGLTKPDFEQYMLDNWRRQIPYVGAHHLTLTADEIKSVVIPRFVGMQQMSWDYDEFHAEGWDGEKSWTPAKDSPYLTVDMVLDIEQMRGCRVDERTGEYTTEFIYSRTSPEHVQHIMNTAAPQAVTDTHPQSTPEHSPLRSVAASLNPPNPQAINSATVSAASAVTVTSPMAHQQVASRTR